ncbi:39S ribosomal protein L33 [Acropora cervicornis]|uniref:Large ribosomal subunit protein bL33m n=1 Tax=Acropora cervicornis TaxID=6130 RepID=A0AAD9QID9_ACRCE|nr:39S ribosomal protein L33 [Acropora cervicornis]
MNGNTEAILFSCFAMAKGKTKRLIVRLVSMAGTGYYYMMTRSRLKTRPLEFMKYDPIVRKHVLFVEQKVKKGK